MSKINLVFLFLFVLATACSNSNGSDKVDTESTDNSLDTSDDSESNDSDGADDSDTQPSGPPNVIVYVSDDIRATHLNAYEGVGVPTPGLDTLASEGMRFEQAHAGASMCTPSRFAILSGLHTSFNIGKPYAQGGFHLGQFICIIRITGQIGLLIRIVFKVV